MRKLNKEHLKMLINTLESIGRVLLIILGWVLIILGWTGAIAAFIFIPYWLSFLYSPAGYSSIQPNIFRWMNGLIDIIIAMLGLIGIGTITLFGYGCYALFDWLFPQVDKKDTKDKE